MTRCSYRKSLIQISRKIWNDDTRKISYTRTLDPCWSQSIVRYSIHLLADNFIKLQSHVIISNWQYAQADQCFSFYLAYKKLSCYTQKEIDLYQGAVSSAMLSKTYNWDSSRVLMRTLRTCTQLQIICSRECWVMVMGVIRYDSQIRYW